MHLHPSIPAVSAKYVSAEIINASGTSQQSAAAPLDTGREYACQIATDTTVYLAFGENPVAVSGAGPVVFGGERVDFALPAGWKVAIVT